MFLTRAYAQKQGAKVGKYFILVGEKVPAA